MRDRLRTVPVRHAGARQLAHRVISPGSPEFSIASSIQIGGTDANSGAWFSANDPLAIPFALSDAAVVKEFGWRNGSGTMTDSFDIGVYDLAWNRLVATGSTARSGSAAWQWVDVTDTALPPGRYYLAMSNNGVTATNVTWYVTMSAALLSLAGVQDSATDAFPLPDPLTNMALAATATRVPIVAVGFEAHFA